MFDYMESIHRENNPDMVYTISSLREVEGEEPPDPPGLLVL